VTMVLLARAPISIDLNRDSSLSSRSMSAFMCFRRVILNVH
jgi:hypothetical protein